MFGLTKEQFLGIFRHLVTFAGGILVARGKLDPAAVESIVGALVTLIGVAFSMMSGEKLPTPGATTVDPPAAAPPGVPPGTTIPNPGTRIVIPPGAQS